MIKTALVYFLVDYCIDKFGSMLESVFTPVSIDKFHPGQKFSMAIMRFCGIHIEMHRIVVKEVENRGLITFTCQTLGAAPIIDNNSSQEYLLDFKKFLEDEGHTIRCISNSSHGIKSLTCTEESTHTIPIEDILFYD